LALLGAASGPAVAQGSIVRTLIELDGEQVAAVWYLPAGEAVALVTVQHGFSRQCDNLRGTTQQLMDSGLMALCLEASMAGGNPALAEALAAALLGGLAAPDGRALPKALIVAGHSAGGLFASRVGWALARSASERLRGALLFDPVAGRDFSNNLAAVSNTGARPVLAVTSNPSGCNVQNNAHPALREVAAAAVGAGGSGFVGVQLIDRSTHVDAEGIDTSALAVRACRQGPPRPANTTALRTLVTQWALDLASGQRTPEVYPDGALIEALRAEGVAVSIE